MPEMEARPPTENRHGGAPKRRARPAGRAPRLSKRGPSRAETRDNGHTAPFGAPLAPHGADGKETSKTRAQQRAAGTKKTALFDMVNRNDAATRSAPRRARASVRLPDDVSCPGQARAAAPTFRTMSVRAREPGPRGDTTWRGKPILRFASLCAGSTQVGFTRLARTKLPISGKPEIGVSFRSLHSPGTRGACLGASSPERCRQTSAMRRTGPPVASFTFANPTTSVAPEGGTLSRLATFSKPQRPDGSQA
jgi:hypothetical protein